MARTPGRLRREPLRAGDMQHQGTLRRITEEQDGNTGAVRPVFTDSTVWADINPLGGREQIDMGFEKAEIRYRVMVHHAANVDLVDQFLFTDREGRARTLEIEQRINFEGRQDHIELICTERIAQ